MEIKCTYCRRELRKNEEVVIDEVNSLYHANCYGEFDIFEMQVNWKDFGTIETILKKHNL
ncbi:MULTISPECIES: hypothetical protein [unclassified Sutcliffiella]|uniref:hypothetical protein n=1 Tax=unclassified Sutcliffiella TaxID=2837532 RepID=UPI0030CCE1F8